MGYISLLATINPHEEMEFVARKIFVLSILLFALAVSSNAQPSSSFTAPTTGCLNETISLNNTSTLATRYVWDFCHTDLQNPNPFATNVTTLPTAGSFYYNAIKLINDNGVNIAFITDTNGVRLYRLNFGSDWSSPNPIIDDLGNFGGSLSSPGAIDAVLDGGVWYVFILNLFGNNLIRLTMGNGLLSAPTLSENLGNIGSSFSTPIGIKVILQGSSRLVFVSNLGNQSISVIDFATSFNSSPSLVHAVSTASIGLIDPSGLDLIAEGSNWFGVVSGFDSGHVVLLNFGNDLLSTPSFTDLGSVPKGRQVRVVKEGLTFTGFVRSEVDGIYKISFGPDFSSPSVPSKLAASFINISRSLDVIKDTPTWKLFTAESTGGNLMRVDFAGDCQSAISANYSTQATPNLQYASSGNYFIELTAFDNSNVMSVASSAITISSFTAPDIAFTRQNDCINNNIDFTSVNQSGNLSNYAWAFGDGGSSSALNPSYVYTSAGTYNVKLVVTDANNCHNTAQKSIQVFNPPTANFTLPSANPFCTGQNYLFTNTSVFDNGSNPSWQWSVNGSNVATTQDVSYLFNSSSAQTITLTASIPGCSSQSTQNIASLVLGPLINFNAPATGCQNVSVAFENKTTDPVTSFSWTFGDGSTSKVNSPSNTYATTGPYQVTLSATNAGGCQNSLSKNINIYSNPDPKFQIEAAPLSCEKWPSQFDNLTPPLVDSNITSWQWSFGDASNGSSAQKNPTYTYNSAGDYNVTLTAKSNFNCTTSVQKLVTILPSPRASFTNSAACVNIGTQFTDNSTGNVTGYRWSIDGNTLTSQNPTYTFNSASSYPVSLMVTSTNGCVNQFPATIVVPPAPTLEFDVQAPCTGHPTVFQEHNPGPPDKAISWNWNFGSGSGTGSPTEYTFPSTGTFSVTMTSTRQSGCRYSFSKSVTIYDGPVASFTPSVLAGAAPLAVTFLNNSTGESSSWNFGDQSAPVDALSPSHTFNSLGAYKVLLTTKSHATCIDTTSTVINVVIPHIDIVMSSFSLTNDPVSNTAKPVVSILNSGNIPLVEPDIVIDLGGGVLLKERISGTVRPGSSIIQTLDLQVIPQSIRYVCAEIDVPDDVNSADNKRCVSLSSDDVLMNPYPNPSSSGHVTLEWIGAVQENVRVTVYKSNGDIAFSQNLDERQSGLGQLTIDTSSFANGLYLIQFVGDKMSRTFRIVIAN
ncbi:MAG TPA: PKD domain-containing protein [Cyclobacteriaceae bacterium]|jgi:PKD repeat protein|nr:PKD domain-containing protein [Cyclobacteriaceae bacterium]